MLVKLNLEFYVDLFLLWLLYRFMKPQKNSQDGRTEASVLLFAHDGKRAQEILFGSQTSDGEQKKVESFQRNYKEFVDFVIKDLIADITTETSVALEFMNQSERESITSSICNFAKAEEISELMEDAYPPDTRRMTDLQSDLMSSSSSDRLIESH